MIIEDGELSTIIAMLPFRIFAEVVSGLSEYFTFGNGLSTLILLMPQQILVVS